MNETEKTTKQSFKDTLNTFCKKLDHQGGSRNIRIPNAILGLCSDWQRAIELERNTHIPTMVNIIVTREDGHSTLTIELKRGVKD